TLMPTGATDAVGISQVNLNPVPNMIANIVVTTESINICAWSPCTFHTETNLLNAEVKPKRKRSKLNPKQMQNKYTTTCITHTDMRIITNKIRAAIDPNQKKGF